MTDLTPRKVIAFPKTPKRLDCQGEGQPYAVNLIDQIQRTKDGLVSGMTAAEIRDAEAQQCEWLLEHAAGRLKHLRTPTRAAMFVSALAIRMNAEIET